MRWIDSRRCLLCQTRGTVRTLFRFPPRPVIKKQWAAFCNMDPALLTTNDCLCIDHFTPDQISPKQPTSKKTKLRLTAVPSIMTSSSSQTAVSGHMKNFAVKRMNQSIVRTEESTISSDPVQSNAIVEVTSRNDGMPKSKKKRITTSPKVPSESALNDLSSCEDVDPSSLVDYKKITFLNVPSQTRNPAAKKTKKIRYIGDVTAEDLLSHENAVKCFYMARNALDVSKKRIRYLNRRLSRMTERVKKYEKILKPNRVPEEDTISDDDFSWPLEEDPFAEAFENELEEMFEEEKN